MIWATKGLLWVPLYLFFLFFVIHKYKWNTFVVVVFATLMILTSDQLTNLVKDWVERLRPSNQPGLLVHLVDAYKGGTFGFYSAHASNTLSIAVFLIIIFGRKYPIVCIPAILWAILMSYSRIYLGVHYPGDILVGWIAGSLEGLLFGRVTVLVCKLITQPGIKDTISPEPKFNKATKGATKP
jgi:undecaprenyl-diphosphatase